MKYTLNAQLVDRRKLPLIVGGLDGQGVNLTVVELFRLATSWPLPQEENTLEAMGELEKVLDAIWQFDETSADAQAPAFLELDDSWLRRVTKQAERFLLNATVSAEDALESRPLAMQARTVLDQITEMTSDVEPEPESDDEGPDEVLKETPSIDS